MQAQSWSRSERSIKTSMAMTRPHFIKSFRSDKAITGVGKFVHNHLRWNWFPLSNIDVNSSKLFTPDFPQIICGDKFFIFGYYCFPCLCKSNNTI